MSRSGNWGHALEDGALPSIVIPQFFKFLLLQERCGEARLRIRIRHQDPASRPGRHPRHVVGKGGPARSASAVEERDDGHGHRPALAVQCTQSHSTRNSGSGFPFSSNSLRANGMPTPKRCAIPRTRIASASTALR